MWREYAHAMAEYQKLRLDIYMATADGNHERELALNASLTAAEATRNAARDVIYRHEQETHEG